MDHAIKLFHHPKAKWLYLGLALAVLKIGMLYATETQHGNSLNAPGFLSGQSTARVR